MTETKVLYDGMPISTRTFDTHYGEIICGGACRDDYNRIIWFQSHTGQNLKLQKAAADSWLAAERRLGFGIPVTGTWRSCALQTEYYQSNPTRYAHPDVTGHTRGLCADVRNDLPSRKQRRIRIALLDAGWHQARPTDEPWHFSYGIKV